MVICVTVKICKKCWPGFRKWKNCPASYKSEQGDMLGEIKEEEKEGADDDIKTKLQWMRRRKWWPSIANKFKGIHHVLKGHSVVTIWVVVSYRWDFIQGNMLIAWWMVSCREQNYWKRRHLLPYNIPSTRMFMLSPMGNGKYSMGRSFIGW